MANSVFPAQAQGQAVFQALAANLAGGRGDGRVTAEGAGGRSRRSPVAPRASGGASVRGGASPSAASGTAEGAAAQARRGEPGHLTALR